MVLAEVCELLVAALKRRRVDERAFGTTRRKYSEIGASMRFQGKLQQVSDDNVSKYVLEVLCGRSGGRAYTSPTVVQRYLFKVVTQ